MPLNFKPHLRSTPSSKPVARPTAQIIRLPIFTDGVFIGNEFVRIGPGLRASIRRMAGELRR
jgi:hypothetical protein